MDMSRFEDQLDTHGADLASWPADLRRDAETLLAASPEARAAHRALAEIEAVWRASASVDQGGGDAMAARAMRHGQIRPMPAAARRSGWAGAAAAALALGLFVGDLMPSHHDESPDRVMAAAFDTSGSSDVD